MSRRLLALAALGLSLAYLPRLGAPLVWDDRPFLLQVAAFDRPLPLAFYASPDYFRETGELTWRPLSSWTYARLVRTFGRRPAPLRASSLALHLLACALLAALMLELGLGSEAAAAAAALFAVHAVHVETLMTVTFDKEILSTLGILGLLVAHRRGRPGLGALALAAGCLAKESGAVGLPLVLLMDALTGGAPELRRRAQAHALYAAALAAYLAPRFGPMKGPGGDAGLSALLPVGERLLHAAHGLLVAARLLLAPAGLRIEWFALPPSGPAEGAVWVLGAFAVVGGLLYGAARARRRDPALAFFLLWPLPALFLVSNVLPTAVLSLRLAAERWLYLPAVGVCAALGVLLRGRPVRAALLVAAWSALAVLRAGDWAAEERLWSSLERAYPASAKAVEGRGEALYRAGRYAEALAEFERGRDLRESRADPVLAHYVPLAPPGALSWESAPLRRWLGLTRLKLGDEDHALAEFAQATVLQPSDVFAYRVLAYENARIGRWTDARRWLEQGQRAVPGDVFLKRLATDAAARKLGFRAVFD